MRGDHYFIQPPTRYHLADTSYSMCSILWWMFCICRYLIMGLSKSKHTLQTRFYNSYILRRHRPFINRYCDVILCLKSARRESEKDWNKINIQMHENLNYSTYKKLKPKSLFSLGDIGFTNITIQVQKPKTKSKLLLALGKQKHYTVNQKMQIKR